MWLSVSFGSEHMLALVCSPFQYVVIPTRRSTAEAVQILTAHAFGDASSPYLMGVVCMFAVPQNSAFTNLSLPIFYVTFCMCACLSVCLSVNLFHSPSLSLSLSPSFLPSTSSLSLPLWLFFTPPPTTFLFWFLSLRVLFYNHNNNDK